jgi:hypothetical protein
MSMKSMTLRWRTVGVCALTVLAMLTLLGGCSKKEQAETTTEEVPAAESVSPVAGTYMADLMAADAATHKVTLTLNADNTAMMSMDMGAGQPAMVENGTWAVGAGANLVDVSFQKAMADSSVTVTLNFAAAGDTLSMTNAAAAGFGPSVTMIKQHAGE